jgi:hypothetical protein
VISIDGTRFNFVFSIPCREEEVQAFLKYGEDNKKLKSLEFLLNVRAQLVE